jgi:predicted transcriptional regulator of viral defense system
MGIKFVAACDNCIVAFSRLSSVRTTKWRCVIAVASSTRRSVDSQAAPTVMVLHNIAVQTHDQDRWESLGRIAEAHAGYVTTAQAEQAGFHRNALRHHAREGGRLERAGRGLYRLRFYPSSPFDHVAAAWVRAGPEIAVVSHESALELYDLSDVVPSRIHLTLPRRYRYRATPIGIRLHYPREPIADEDIRRIHGLPATSPERTILDALVAGTQLEQIEMAVNQAVERALTTPERLRAAAEDRPATVRATVERMLPE